MGYRDESAWSPRSITFAALFVIVLICTAILAPQLYENVPMGKYHITQSPFTGKIEARMIPGPYMQLFAHVEEFPVSETYEFTEDGGEGGAGDDSVEVQFADGSLCRIIGTCRVDMPRDSDSAIKLITEHGYRTHSLIEDKLIKQVLRRAMTMEANAMTAKESYSDKRANFVNDAWDQITNGVYVMRDVTRKEPDPISGELVTRTFKEPVLDPNGVKLREANPLKGTGIVLSNFEVKKFVYEAKVLEQISKQQAALMDVQTAKAGALKAEQERLTAEATGKANVMKAKYEKETLKTQAEVIADQEKSVAVTKAQQFVEVASKEKEQALVVAARNRDVALIELEAAKLEKQRQIELATGQSESRRLILQADNALSQKLEAYQAVNKVWAEAFASRKVPGVVMQGGAGGGDNDVSSFMQILGAKAAKDLALDLEVKSPK